MKDNFPNLVKGIDMQVQEAERFPNKMDANRPSASHIIIKMPKFKDKKRILKAARENQLVTHKGIPIRLLANFSLNKNFAGQKGLPRNIQSHEKQGPIDKIALPSKAIT